MELRADRMEPLLLLWRRFSSVLSGFIVDGEDGDGWMLSLIHAASMSSIRLALVTSIGMNVGWHWPHARECTAWDWMERLGNGNGNGNRRL